MRLHVVIISQLTYGANRWFVHSQILRHKTDMFDIRQLYTYIHIHSKYIMMIGNSCGLGCQLLNLSAPVNCA